jgi:single-stranded-DNA-specific exonuclease
VVNPKRADCESGFKEYAGVGVAFKLACALEGDTDVILEKYGDLVALGTLGDVMLIEGENRALVRAGLKVLNQNTRPGIYAIKKLIGLECGGSDGYPGFGCPPFADKSGDCSRQSGARASGVQYKAEGYGGKNP